MCKKIWCYKRISLKLMVKIDRLVADAQICLVHIHVVCELRLIVFAFLECTYGNLPNIFCTYSITYKGPCNTKSGYSMISHSRYTPEL